jgi:hypothetical protein
MLKVIELLPENKRGVIEFSYDYMLKHMELAKSGHDSIFNLETANEQYEFLSGTIWGLYLADMITNDKKNELLNDLTEKRYPKQDCEKKGESL